MTAVLHADAPTCLQSKSQTEDCTGKQQGPTTMSRLSLSEGNECKPKCSHEEPQPLLMAWTG